MSCTTAPNGSLECATQCPKMSRAPLLAPCPRDGYDGLYDCICDAEQHRAGFTCSSNAEDPDAPARCIWIAGGGPTSAPQVVVDLGRERDELGAPLLQRLPRLAGLVRSCADNHLPLVWKDADGAVVPGSSVAWAVTDGTSSHAVVLSGPNVQGAAATGGLAWQPDVLAAPDVAASAFGACVYDATERQLRRWTQSSLLQLTGMRPH